jgi:hypothetical protein
MLIDLQPVPPFSGARLTRLRVLERRVRCRASASVTLRDHETWLEAAGVELPSRRTLLDDFVAYAEHCDDVAHEPWERGFSLRPDVGEDARRYLLGAAWVDTPLAPALSSAALRCLLLARQLARPVRFQYRPVRGSDEPWRIENYQAYPLRLIPGRDSGYMQCLTMHPGTGEVRRMNLNLARLAAASVSLIEDAPERPPAPPDPPVSLVIETMTMPLRQRLLGTFPGLCLQGDRLVVQLPDSEVVMAADLLKDHIRRTTGSRDHLPWEHAGVRLSVVPADTTDI